MSEAFFGNADLEKCRLSVSERLSSSEGEFDSSFSSSSATALYDGAMALRKLAHGISKLIERQTLDGITSAQLRISQNMTK